MQKFVTWFGPLNIIYESGVTKGQRSSCAAGYAAKNSFIVDVLHFMTNDDKSECDKD